MMPSAKKSDRTPSDVDRKNRQLRSAQKDAGLVGMMGSLTLEHLSAQPKGVGLVYDEAMVAPVCEWDPKFPECPRRATASWDRCSYYGLTERCVRIPARMAEKEEILLYHTEEYHDFIQRASTQDLETRRTMSRKFDAICIPRNIYESAMSAVGSCIKLTDNILEGKIRHGLAIIRPPGHHAMADKGNGYCYFNNVALAAKHAVDVLGLQRVMIIDWDVHHGQGTQYAFYDDPRVLYFSNHRYEYGNFWPNLRESDYDFIGSGRGKKYNINFPFNTVDLTDADFLAIFQQIVLPVAHQFNPQLVFISAGYDAGIGDPEGLSWISPACYGHLTHMLKTVADGKLAVILEGGYCIKSQAEAVAMTLRALLDEPLPQLDLKEPLPEIQEMIMQVIRVLRPYWKCFSYHKEAQYDEELPTFFRNIEVPKQGVVFAEVLEEYTIDGEALEKHCPERAAELDVMIDALIARTKIPTYIHRTGLVYDEYMRRHSCRTENENFMTHPERPDRISRIFEKHQECGLTGRCHLIQSRRATDKELEMVHCSEYIDKVKSYQNMSTRDLAELESSLNSVYLSQNAYDCASLATGCTLKLVDSVMSGECLNGVAIIRPPGHHAEPDFAMGFCYFNSAAIAAKYAQKNYGAKKILLLDWDVHHGNGTQTMFYEDPSVLFISLHRHDFGSFYPIGSAGSQSSVGKGLGEGFNINIPWNQRGMGDSEYIAAFQQIVMPVAFEYNPDLVVVSAGFDAARGDPLGGCKVSPQGFAYMTHQLSALAGGKIILILEGGYNLNSISESMAACTSVLLGDKCGQLTAEPVKEGAIKSISDVLDVQQKYWKNLRYRVKMPSISQTKSWLKSLHANENVHENSNESNLSSPASPVSSSTSSSSMDASMNDSKVTVEVKVEPPVVEAVDKVITEISHVNGFDEKEKHAEVSVVNKEPEVTVVNKEPEVTVVNNEPEVAVVNKEPEVTVVNKEPEVTVVNKEPEVAVDNKDPEVAVDNKEPEVAVDHKEPEVAVDNKESGAAVDTKEGEVTVDTKESDAVGACGSVDPAQEIITLDECHAVVPLSWCPHLSDVSVVPDGRLDTGAACEVCRHVGENWVCLTCYKVYCSRYVNEHMLVHATDSGHQLVLSYADLSAWCYACNAYVHNEVLLEAKQLAHVQKFSEASS